MTGCTMWSVNDGFHETYFFKSFHEYEQTQWKIQTGDLLAFLLTGWLIWQGDEAILQQNMLEKACELLKTATLHLIFMANVYHRSYRGARIGHSSKPSGIPKVNTVQKMYVAEVF